MSFVLGGLIRRVSGSFSNTPENDGGEELKEEVPEGSESAASSRLLAPLSKSLANDSPLSATSASNSLVDVKSSKKDDSRRLPTATKASVDLGLS